MCKLTLTDEKRKFPAARNGAELFQWLLLCWPTAVCQFAGYQTELKIKQRYQRRILCIYTVVNCALNHTDQFIVVNGGFSLSCNRLPWIHDLLLGPFLGLRRFEISCFSHPYQIPTRAYLGVCSFVSNAPTQQSIV